MRPAWSSRTAQAGGADRDVGLAGAPGPAGGVGDHDGDVAAGRARTTPRRGSPRAEASGSSGSSTTCPAVTLEASTPAAAITDAEVVRDDRGGAAAGDHPDGLRRDRRVAVVAGDQPALGLADHLAGDQRRRRRRARSTRRRAAAPTRSVARPCTSRDAVGRRRPRAGAHRDQAERGGGHGGGRVVRRSCSRGTARQRMPAASMRATERSGVDGVDQPAVEHAAGRPGAVVLGRPRPR